METMQGQDIFNLQLIQKNFSYQFVKESNNWKQMGIQQFHQKQNIDNEIIRIGTYNVLFGSPKTSFNFVIRNQTRFNYIANKTLKKVNSDIVGFCETNQQFINTLKQSDFVKESYYLSEQKIIYPQKSHELFLAAKKPFIAYSLGGKQGAHMGRYLMTLFPNHDNSDQSIIVFQLHLFAYEEKFSVRQNQMKEIDEFLNRLKKNPEVLEKNEEILIYLKSALQNNNIIAQGDLNLHNNIENNYIYQTGFIDTWIEKHGLGKQSEEQGYTWDPTQNSMIRMILPFDNRRMRLDRILLRQESNYLQVENVSVMGKEKIGYNLVGSDHFYLVADFKIKKEGKKYQQKILIEENQFQGKGTGFRTINQIIGLRLFSLIVFPVGIGYGIYNGIASVFEK